MTETISPVERDNNFDALRISAAFLVLFSHSFPLSYGTNKDEPLWVVSGNQTTLGSVAVAVFFIISGYLITQSYKRSRSPLRFLRARALRLLPGLASALVLLAFFFGPVLTTEPAKNYFGYPQVLDFILLNLSLTTFTDGLPGVFETLPFRNAVNGSLWTLRYEAYCYAFVLFLGIAGWLNRWTVLAVFASALIASKFWVGGELVGFGSYFVGGAMMYFWRPPLKGSVAALCVIILTIAVLTGGFRLACSTAGVYLVIFAAFKPVRLPSFGRSDISYGVYVWAFPVQQSVTMYLGRSAAWWSNILISTPIVIGFAWLSWHLVEAPALSLRDVQWKYPRRLFE